MAGVESVCGRGPTRHSDIRRTPQFVHSGGSGRERRTPASFAEPPGMQGGMMGYGQMRGMGGGGGGGGGGHRQNQPQPQRQNNRRNNRFRGRFDNRGGNNQQTRSNKEIKTESAPTESPQKPVQELSTPAPVVPQPQPQLVQPQQPKPAQSAVVNKPAQPVSAMKPPQSVLKPQQNIQKPPSLQQSQPANQQQKNQNDIKSIVPKNMNASNTSLNSIGSQQSSMNSNKPQQNNMNTNKPQQNNMNANKPQQNNMNANKQQSQQNSAGKGNNNNSNQQGGNNNNSGGGSGNRMNARRQQGPDKGGQGGREEHFMAAKLKEIGGSTIDLPPLDQTEQKFSGRNRLYIGNLTNDITEQEISDIFNQYGETSELFVNKDKNFAFIRVDYKANADKAKREVDGRMRRGRPLRVRFAPHNAAIKVKNLTSHISNELLHRSFEVFGKIERAIVKVDDRGKSLGEGIVEFARKAGAMAALRHCTERCFFLTASLRPVVVESYEEVDELDGYTEKTLPRKNQDYLRAREIGPRFAELGSFEHEYGTRWKQLYESYKQKEDALRREMHMEEEKLEARMEYAKYEHETELLREQLRQRESDRERQKRSWEMAERQADEQREKDREVVLRQQEDMAQRMRLQEDELRRRQQENTLFMQAQQLNRILDEQEQGMGGAGRGYESPPDKRGFDGSISNMGPMSSMGGSMQMDTPYMEHFDQMCGHMGYEEGMGRWDNRQEDYPNKRRRY